MTSEQISSLLEKQREYYKSGATIPVKFRIEQLKKLYATIKKYETEVNDALTADLGKSHYEGFMCESGLVLSEISYMIRHTKRFAKRKTVYTPLAQFSSHSFKQPVPYGNTLIMSPWNYPFLLTIDPLADAIAAGNTAIVKPSAYSPATSKIIEKILTECFEPEYVAVVMGGRAENAALLEQKFDFVFFTGSQAVGKEVLRHTAEHLTPAVLELGGKSPCIVDATANIKLAAKRIVWGKYLNCGQTCVAPDYILCESSIKDEFVTEVIKQIKKQFGENPLENKDYGKIINEKHFDRLCGLINKNKVVIGGNTNPETCQIAPTVMDNVTYDDAVMGEEIFGPIMPILTFDSFDNLVDEADLVITGEGTIDAQSLMGKALTGLLRRSNQAGVPVLAIAGHIVDKEAVIRAGVSECLEVSSRSISLEEAMQPDMARQNIISVISNWIKVD